MEHYTIDYNKYVKLCYIILNDIQKGNKVYQGLLCLLKGGFFLSYFMERHLKIPIHYLEISSYKGKDQQKFKIGNLPILDSGKFLLCDDIYDSGNTINKIKEIYNHLDIDTACLVTRENLNNLYYGEHINHDRWVDFFWEIF